MSLETEFGCRQKVKTRLPLMTGALGSTFVAAKYWDSFAVGAALVGIPIVVGENVVGIDPKARIESGRIVEAPELDRRIPMRARRSSTMASRPLRATAGWATPSLPEKRHLLNSHWERLPNSVSGVGTYPEEIFAGYFDLQQRVGDEEMQNILFGAIAFWTLADKLAAGLQQLMAGARKFSLAEVAREEIVSANRETEAETGIPFITEVLDDSAKSILTS